ncbi:MAG: hypothetical protein HY762_04220 [Planctomycetes bacterium]|nr:hypothetical protein [Planctomycetota bacterium]
MLKVIPKEEIVKQFNKDLGINNLELNPQWLKFIRYCEKIGFGELQKVQIQNGIPISAEKATKKVKFT